MKNGEDARMRMSVRVKVGKLKGAVGTIVDIDGENDEWLTVEIQGVFNGEVIDVKQQYHEDSLEIVDHG